MTDMTTAQSAGSETPSRPAATADSGIPKEAVRVNRDRKGRKRSIGAVFVAPYAVFMLAFGVLPALYAIYLALTDADGGFAPTANFSKVIDDFRFFAAARHVAFFLVIWLAAPARAGRLPGDRRARHPGPLAERERSPVLLPARRPGRRVERAAVAVRARSRRQPRRPAAASRWASTASPTSSSPSHLPLIFAIIAFWTGAGGWIIVMYGALNNISTEIMEAARIDGASPVQIALAHPAAAAAQVDRLHGGPVARGRHAAVRRAARCCRRRATRSYRTTTRSTSSPTSTRSTRTTSTAPRRSPCMLLVVALAAVRRLRRQGRPVRYRGRMSTTLRLDSRRTGAASRSSRGWSGRSIIGLVLVVATLFFIVPLVWLLLATTKTEHELAVRYAVRDRLVGHVHHQRAAALRLPVRRGRRLDAQLGALLRRRARHHARRSRSRPGTRWR